jgi:hypothetical protein
MVIKQSSAALVDARPGAHIHIDYSTASKPRSAMKRVLFTMFLCALGPAQASAQNDTSQQLLEFDEEQRNAAFTHMLREDERKCDQVIRTLFNGTVLGVDDWEVLCRDGRSYSISVLVEPELHDTIITLLICRELSATSSMLLQRSGSRRKAAHCRIK